MNKYLFLILGVLSGIANASELSNYADVKSAVYDGKHISVLIDFSECTLGSGGKPAMKMSAALNPAELIINNNKGYITSSLFHFTLSHPSYPGKGVYEFSKYTITKDDNFTYSIQVVDPVNYLPLNEPVIFNCKLGTGVKIHIENIKREEV